MDSERLPYQYEGINYHQHYWKKIEQMFGRRPSAHELLTAYTDSTDPNSDNLLLAELSMRSPRDRQYSERFQWLGQMIESIYNQPYPVYMSYGIALPTYLRHLQEYRARVNETHHKALLVGALTADSVREFSVGLHSLFPQCEPVIIDIEGEETVQAAEGFHVNFYFADAFNPCLREIIGGDYDSIHTNLLLPALGTNSQFHQMKFFSNMHQLLRPGGRMIMVEGDDDHDPEKYGRKLRAEAINTGFRNVAVEPVDEFSRRRYLDQFLMSTHGQIRPEHLRKEHRLRALVAEKV